MKLVIYENKFKNHIDNYRLDDNTYTGVPKEIIRLEKNTYFPILCFEQSKLVSFFVLDEGEDKYKYTSEQNSLLLRSFSTDSNELRKGYALKSLFLLKDFTKLHFPNIKKIVLGVNEMNDIAIKLYLKAGFKNTGKYFLGSKGLQNILELTI